MFLLGLVELNLGSVPVYRIRQIYISNLVRGGLNVHF